MLRPGTSWTACHLAAEREVLRSLKKLGVVVGDLDEAQGAALGGVFLPCGLGHFIGIDTHDVGGYLPAHAEPSGTRTGFVTCFKRGTTDAARMGRNGVRTAEIGSTRAGTRNGRRALASASSGPRAFSRRACA